MNKIVCCLILIAALVPSPVSADVTMKMATTDAQGRQAEDNLIQTQSGRIRVDNMGGAPGHISMIFRDNAMVILNHDEKTYYVIDEATLAKVSTRMSDAMKMMERQMSQMPPEQRAMVEQMMKGRMQGMGAPRQQAKKEPPRIEATGQTEWQSYSCTRYEVFDGGAKTQEICAASMDQIEGAEEMTDAFRQMAAFMKKMTESFSAGPLARAGRTPMDMMLEIGGFPVHTRYFENGAASHEVFLKSVVSGKLDPALFEAPRGYKRQDLTQ